MQLQHSRKYRLLPRLHRLRPLLDRCCVHKLTFSNARCLDRKQTHNHTSFAVIFGTITASHTTHRTCTPNSVCVTCTWTNTKATSATFSCRCRSSEASRIDTRVRIGEPQTTSPERSREDVVMVSNFSLDFVSAFHYNNSMENQHSSYKHTHSQWVTERGTGNGSRGHRAGDDSRQALPTLRVGLRQDLDAGDISDAGQRAVDEV